MGSLRRAVEAVLEERHRTTFMRWVMPRLQQTPKPSLRVLAAELSQMVGFPVSHESIRQWVVDG